jgi:hypothetical protein
MSTKLRNEQRLCPASPGFYPALHAPMGQKNHAVTPDLSIQKNCRIFA